MRTDENHTDSDEKLAELRNLNQQLQFALQSRITVEQAKGVLAERYHLPIDEAFVLLRYAARSSRQSIHVLAQAVVSLEVTPEPVLAALTGGHVPRRASPPAGLRASQRAADSSGMDRGQVAGSGRYASDLRRSRPTMSKEPAENRPGEAPGLEGENRRGMVGSS